MSDTKYNFDDYIFDNVLEDTYLAIKDVRENIKSRRYGFDILSSAFGNLADHIHEAKQVAEDLSYDVGAPKHFDDCIQYLKEQTEEFVLSDKAWERIGGK